MSSSGLTQDQAQEIVSDKPIVISSIDTFYPLSGLKTKLRGYHQFMQKYPKYKNKLVLIQFIPSIYCNSDVTMTQSAKTNYMD